MSNNNEQYSLDLKTLLSSGKYIIPVYQRNYAWGKAEISQLIRDINEFFQNSTDKNYYIGSLVCFKRENGDYELIDGQQRHTTISLINAILKSKEIHEVIPSTNLKFDSRKNVQQFLEELHNASDMDKYLESTSISGIQNFKAAIDFIQEEIQVKNFKLDKFAENFYNKVKFFRVEVPQDTDLNHYFEIMNNRGEQLEKHEIVKANLMEKIKNDNRELERKEQETFAIIWDACSDVNDYVYFNFNTDNRKVLFDNNGNLKAEIDSFSKIHIAGNTDNGEEKTLADILSEDILPENFPKEETQKEKYKSVIDFPNFLLQVLKLKNEFVSLDDKKLLEQFNNSEIKIAPKEFIYDLLKYRTIFDKYIIKQDLADADENNRNWGIRSLKIEPNEKEDTKKHSLGKTYDNDDELVKLQTMLYYSNSANTNNTWLQEILKFEQRGNVEKYTKKVFEIAKSRFDRNNSTYPEITIFNLYFIDFLLWKLWKQEEIKDYGIKKGEDIDKTNLLNNLKTRIYNVTKKEGKDDYKNLFQKYKFKHLSSKEHLASQTNAHLNKIEAEYLHGIGNLCLISTNQNSQGNKENPSDKKKRYENDNSSLKRLIMFETFENDKWETGEIKNHEQEIRELINQFAN